MNLNLYVWRQKGPNAPGKLEQLQAKNISPDMSFLEMLDEVNEDLVRNGKEPILRGEDYRRGWEHRRSGRTRGASGPRSQRRTLLLEPAR